MEVLPDLSRQTMEAAAMEGLRQQAVAMNSAVEEAKDAVARDQSLRILGRRRAELDEAYDSYQLAFQCYRRVADRGSCSFSTALAARHLILGFWDKAMDELEARMEVKEEENVGAEQEEEEFSADEDDVEDRAIRSHDVDQAAEVEVGCAKTDEAFQSGARDPGEGGQIDANDELECGAAKDDFWQGGGALDPGEGDCEIGAKVKVEKIDVYKVRAEEFANLEVLRAGQLDPGEVRGSWKEVPWLNVEVQQFGVEEPRIDKDGLEYRDIQDELEFRDAKKELQELRIPESNHEEELNVEFEPLRFVKAGCRAQGTNSEYG